MRRLVLLPILLASWLAGCALPPAAAGPGESVSRIHEPLVNGGLVTIEVVHINGQTPPGRSMEQAIATFCQYVAGKVQTVQGEPVIINTGKNPLPMQSQLDETIAHRRYCRPCDITVYVTPGLMEMNTRGVCMWMDDGSHVVVLAGNNVDKAAGLFRETGWRIITAHELCHALGVPADRSHAWEGWHCTHPECLVYPRVDCRSALTALLRLWPPLDLCKVCQADIRRVQKAAEGTFAEPAPSNE